MNDLSTLLYVAVLLSSGLSAAAYIVFFISRRKGVQKTARTLLFLSCFLQTIFILDRFFHVGHTPITSPFETLMFFAWSTTVAFISFHWKFAIKNFGVFVASLIFILLFCSLFVSREIIVLPPKLQSIWLPIHAGLSIFSYGFLALAFCGSLMYLIMERELKQKRLGFFFDRLPSLESLDQLNNYCITIGFAFFTVGLLTGVLWSKQVWGEYWRGGSKEIWSAIFWFAILVQVHQRYSVGWRGKRAALMTVGLFAVLMLTLFGVTYLLGGTHGHAI